MTLKPIDPEALRLPEGSRILLLEAVPGIVSHEIKPFGETVRIPGVSFVPPPGGKEDVKSLEAYVRKACEETSAALALVITPMTRTERQYGAYPAAAGFREKTYRTLGKNGRPTYEIKTEPRLETRYRFVCRRTSYWVYHYTGDGELAGSIYLQGGDAVRCPEDTDRDVLLDDLELLLGWIRSRVSVR
jgi:hypothetical protein